MKAEVVLVVLLILVGAFLGFSALWAAVKAGPGDSHRAYATRKGYLAAGILAGLGAIFMSGMVLYYYSSEKNSVAGKEIFDGCKVIVPPFFALVIGYFFGSSGSLLNTNEPEKNGEKTESAKLPPTPGR